MWGAQYVDSLVQNVYISFNARLHIEEEIFLLCAVIIFNNYQKHSLNSTLKQKTFPFLIA